jgi:23S rRNA (adenine2030-N6)-methyltransferase
LNYRHAFHAGNFADVHKHILLLALIDRLQRKPKPLLYLDTHAGRGWYDLRSGQSQRGGEWQAGVAHLMSAQIANEDIQRYQLAVRRANPADAVQRYPGSPILALDALRDADRAVLVEQQSEEAQALRDATRSRRGVSVVCGDGYAALTTYLPPRENRGLVLIDPPYESDSEFADVARALQTGLARWPTGVFALWYPIKAGPQSRRLLGTLQDSGLRKLLVLELSVHPADSPVQLNGSGLLIANPPWQFDTQLAPALDQVHAALAPHGLGGSRVEWLVGE